MGNSIRNLCTKSLVEVYFCVASILLYYWTCCKESPATSYSGHYSKVRNHSSFYSETFFSFKETFFLHQRNVLLCHSKRFVASSYIQRKKFQESKKKILILYRSRMVKDYSESQFLKLILIIMEFKNKESIARPSFASDMCCNFHTSVAK